MRRVPGQSIALVEIIEICRPDLQAELGSRWKVHVAPPNPSWMLSGNGKSDILILAPHGGISEKDLLQPSSWPRKGNDLHTAALARRLADDLSASFLINEALDRNSLDLNRIDQTAAEGRVFLKQLEAHLGRILEQHPRVRVLVVHGWHITQAKVDLGLGQRLKGTAPAEAASERLTCSLGFLTDTMDRLRAGLAAVGIEATCGEQWPGAHRNNMLQLFRQQGGAAVPKACEAIRAIASSGRIDAVQLELGAPLRWPGTPSDQFCSVLRDVLEGGSPAGPARTSSGPFLEPEPRQASLQFVDKASGLTVLAGMALMPNRTMGARFMFFLPDGRVGVFVGHGRPRGALQIHGFSLQQDENTLGITFDSHLHLSANPTRYFQFETEQSATPLHRAQLDCEAHTSDRSTLVTGTLRVDGTTYPLQATGLPGPLAGGPFGRQAGRRLYLAHPDGRAEKLRLPNGPIDDICVADDGRKFTIEPGRQLAILRPQPDRAMRLEFGPAKFVFADGGNAIGLMETIHELRPNSSNRQSG